MVVNVLGPMMYAAAVDAVLVPDLWAETIGYVLFDTPGASGLWQNVDRTRCTFARPPVRLLGECALAA